MRQQRTTLQHAVLGIFNSIIKLKPSESVLVIGSDQSNSRIVSQAFYQAGLSLTARSSLIEQTARKENEYMEETVRSAIASAPDVVILTDVSRMGRDRVGEEKGYMVDGKRLDFIYYAIKAQKKSRVYWFYVDSIPRFIRMLSVDYAEMRRVGTALVREMTKADAVRIRSAAGTDLTVSLADKKRKPKADYNGKQHIPGSGGNLPMGEVLISPTAAGTNGRFVVDGSFFHVDSNTTLRPSKPFAIDIRDGYVQRIEQSCAEAKNCSDMVQRARRQATRMDGRVSASVAKQYYKYARLVGEFAIGVNPNARIVGDILEDEKASGTAHIAIGSSYDGERALIHLDLVVRRPEISFVYPKGTEKIIVRSGSVLV
ncbi:MAG: hypothetical protein ABIG66_02180 [Candidatus Kerfeldbacteria bacterium]